MTRRSLLSLLSIIVLFGSLSHTHDLRADDEPPAEEPSPTQSVDDEEEKSNQQESETADSLPEPPEETREARRQRLRHQASSGLGSPLSLLNIPQIQNELNLSERQQREIADQVKRLRIRIRYRFKDVADLPREQQAAEMLKLQVQTRPFLKQSQRGVMNVLTEEQRLRLLGISLQIRGPKSLMDEEVVELLELTDDQVKQIVDILEEYDLKLRKAADLAEQKPDQPLILIQPVSSHKKLNEEAEQKILDVLTEQQREMFQQLQGEPYVFQPTPNGTPPTLIETSGDKNKPDAKPVPGN